MVDIQPYLDRLTEKHKEEYTRLYPNLTPPEFDAKIGSKFTKVIRLAQSSKSVHCFIDNANGDIYKAASWKARAKHVRGNINDVKPPLSGYDYYIRH